ncbi:MAG: DUF1573 domain-containing protein [Alistipes sp.]
MDFKHLINSILLTLCTLTAVAQPALRFEPAAWDFGTIQEADGSVTHTFVGYNDSNKPIVILDAAVSCGCLRPEYSRKPLLPGDKTNLTITYDPTNRPGRFDKEVIIRTSGSKESFKIHLSGVVIGRAKALEETYPLDAGNGLRLTTNFFPFSYIYQGDATHAVIGLVNASSQAISIQTKSRRNSGFLTVSCPATLAAGERSEIRLRYLIPEQRFYGTVRDEMMLIVNGQTSILPLSVHGIAVDKKDALPDASAPSLVVDKSTIQFGELQRLSHPKPQKLTLHNTGYGPLIIRAVETDQGRAICSLKAGRTVPAGGKLVVEVNFNTSRAEFGAATDRITIITNDPIRPMRKIRVTAILTD